MRKLTIKLKLFLLANIIKAKTLNLPNIFINTCFASLLIALLPFFNGSAQASKEYKVVVVSCSKIHLVKEQKIWGEIKNLNPDLLLLIGDNVYLDKKNRIGKSMEDIFVEQWNEPNFKNLISSVPYFAIWDDHDAGTNNITPNALSPDLRNKFMPLYKEARNSFKSRIYNHNNIDLYRNGNLSKIEHVNGSTYLTPNFYFDNQPTLDYSFKLGGAKFIMLDTITSRTEPGSQGKILSEQQFSFLKRNIDNHVGLNFIVTGASVHLSNEWGWREGYNNQYQKLKSLLRHNSIILSGDTHRNATIPMNTSIGVVELVSSGVALSVKKKGNYLLLSYRHNDLDWLVRFQHFGERLKKKYNMRAGDLIVNHD